MNGLQWTETTAPLLGRMRIVATIASVNADGSTGATVATPRGAWMSMTTIGLEEGESAQAIRAQGRYLFVMRFRTDILTTMRAIVDGVTYEIRSVQDPDGHRRWLACDFQSAK